jgi:hypothetical protein
MIWAAVAPMLPTPDQAPLRTIAGQKKAAIARGFGQAIPN